MTCEWEETGILQKKVFKPNVLPFSSGFVSFNLYVLVLYTNSMQSKIYSGSFGTENKLCSIVLPNRIHLVQARLLPVGIRNMGLIVRDIEHILARKDTRRDGFTDSSVPYGRVVYCMTVSHS